MGSGAVLLIADADGKAAVAAGVTEDLTDRVSAVDLVQGGGAASGRQGRRRPPDMAQGGGRDAGNADAAIAAAEAVLSGEERGMTAYMIARINVTDPEDYAPMPARPWRWPKSMAGVSW